MAHNSHVVTTAEACRNIGRRPPLVCAVTRGASDSALPSATCPCESARLSEGDFPGGRPLRHADPFIRSGRCPLQGSARYMQTHSTLHSRTLMRAVQSLQLSGIPCYERATWYSPQWRRLWCSHRLTVTRTHKARRSWRRRAFVAMRCPGGATCLPDFVLVKHRCAGHATWSATPCNHCPKQVPTVH